MATPKYDSMPEYREALSERARGLDGLLEPLRSEALQLLWAPVAEGAPASLGSYFDASEVEDVIESVDFFEELFEDIKKTNMVAKGPNGGVLRKAWNHWKAGFTKGVVRVVDAIEAQRDRELRFRADAGTSKGFTVGELNKTLTEASQFMNHTRDVMIGEGRLVFDPTGITREKAILEYNTVKGVGTEY